MPCWEAHQDFSYSCRCQSAATTRSLHCDSISELVGRRCKAGSLPPCYFMLLAGFQSGWQEVRILPRNDLHKSWEEVAFKRAPMVKPSLRGRALGSRAGCSSLFLSAPPFPCRRRQAVPRSTSRSEAAVHHKYLQPRVGLATSPERQ